MKHYLDWIPISARVHRRQSRMTRLCIALSVFLIAAIFAMADMEIRTQYIQSARSDGVWHAMFRDVDETRAAIIAARPEVEQSARYAATNYRLDQGYAIAGTQAAICGFDEGFLALFPAIEIVEGAFPQTADEAVVTESVRDRLSLHVGDRLTLDTPGGPMVYTVSGFTGETSMLTQYDAFGLFVNTDAYAAAFGGDTLAQDWACYVRFKPSVRVSDAVRAICGDLGMTEESVGTNAKLLMLTLQSEDPYILKLYAVAGVLAALVLVAGVLMIASSMNSVVARRTAFFGLLRCLGATPGQVTRFVYLEALLWCRSAIPMGLAASVVVVWGLCAMLKALSPGIFAYMPVFGVSVPGLVSGAAIGLATVLLAARDPAGRASRVSPITAAAGYAGAAAPVRGTAWRGRLPVSVLLGFHHAAGSGKNFALMAGSFALSVVLFLSFGMAVDFGHHAIRPLQPYTPDLSLYDGSRCVIPRETAGEIAAHPAVERAYGRSFAYDVPLEVNGEARTCTLISYEENQFAWAEKSLLFGDVDAAVRGEGVLSVYRADLPIEAGESVTLDLPGGMQTVRVAGVISDSPFVSGQNVLFCSEALFEQLIGETRYTIVDIQLKRGATDGDVKAIRALWGAGLTFSDRRMSNGEARGAYYAFAVFVYGFLAIIVLISAVGIVNGIHMSVFARMRQLGAMRAIGMADAQVTAMIACEAGTYALAGIALGSAAGIPIQRALYMSAITSRWGTPWSPPLVPLAVIAGVIGLSVLLAVAGPSRMIRAASIVDTIGEG